MIATFFQAYFTTLVKGAFLKEMSLTADKLSQMIEVRSGALRCIQLLAKDEEKCPIIEHVLRSALEYMGHVNKLLAKYPQLKPALKFYKMRLYSTLTETQSIIWEYGLPDLFKHVVADLILTDVQQVSHSSLLSSLVSENQADILIDSTDLEFNFIGSLQHSASEIVTSSTEMPKPYPLQIQLIDSAVKLFGYAFPLAAMKHRAQITQHFIDCLRQAKKERALCIQINILAAYAMALKSLGQARGTVGDEAILKCSAELLLSFVSHQSHTVRCVASSGLGRLAQESDLYQFIPKVCFFLKGLSRRCFTLSNPIFSPDFDPKKSTIFLESHDKITFWSGFQFIWKLFLSGFSMSYEIVSKVVSWKIQTKKQFQYKLKSGLKSNFVM